MARIATWLRGLDLEMVLAWDLSSVAQWLSSISAHEDRIKIYPTNFFFFYFFSLLLVNASFLFLSFLFFFFFFFFFFFEF
jgi:hypothetical protein